MLKKENPPTFPIDPRYGFNGKLKDNEVEGEGDVYDFNERIYDVRVGRFLSVDQFFKGYPWYTPYQFAGNSPIEHIDVDGLEENKPDNTNNNDKPKQTVPTSSDVKRKTDQTGNNNAGVPVPVDDKNKKNISKVSWGETGGIYPQKENKYNPEKWDKEKLKELQKARAGIIEVEKRNSDVHKDSPDLENPLVKKLAAYYLSNNLPQADPEIKNDAEVTFFYLGQTKD